MSPTEGKTIWLCGMTRLKEFQAARQWLAERYEVLETEQLKTLAGQFPAALVIRFLGPWCDGMGRTPGHLPDVLRVSWQSWETELPQALRPPNEVTEAETEADRLMELSGSHQPRIGGTVGIVATSRVAADALIDAVKSCGPDAFWLRDIRDLKKSAVEQLIIDLDGRRDEQGWLGDWLAAAGQKRIILAASFGRLAGHENWKKRGIAAIVCKPFTLARLHFALSPTLLPGNQRRF